MDTELGRLVEVDVREAWRHEAQDFTPWLAENLEALGEAIGIPLELKDTEVAVDNFAADIQAIDERDGSVVLIENQLGKTDHAHLGQILTYLAGLNAQTVVWIAAAFQEAHLSAIRWLNDHTADDFAFFAVRLRLVRIGDSPLAPVFDVLAKPSGWERALREKSARQKYSAESERYFEFWTFYLERHPQAKEDGVKPYRFPSVYTELLDGKIIIGISAGKQAGVFVRSQWGDLETARKLLAPHLEELANRLGARIFQHHKNGVVLAEYRPLSIERREDWPKVADWLEERRQAYKKALLEVLSEGSA